MRAVLLLLALALPNPHLTPGIARPLSVTELCATKWGHDRRHVTMKMKQQVAAAYGVAWADHRLYEFDHLIPRELGGADDVRNLWPQPWPEARVKDREENRLHQAVCRDSAITLAEAQKRIAAWGR